MNLKNFSCAEFGFLNEHNLLTITWTKLPSSDEYRAVVSYAYQQYDENTLAAMLFNCEKMGAVSEDNQAWSVQEWMKVFNPDKPTRVAIVLAEEIFTQLSFEGMMDQINNQQIELNTQYFANIKEAKEWLITTK